MDTSIIQSALESAIIKRIKTGDIFKMDYNSRVDLSAELKTAYKNIDYDKIYPKITALLEERIAEKIVNKIITEMGTDIKGLMSHNEIREDFKFLMRKGVETIMEKIRK